ncbi:glycosyltransferase 87 family protein [Streptacidiphilus neutrinimicus]|uniref:glycosyltransferase 87 family protein n=1 Tax=Streptacidiphilus neutrinimicus TaxID=105420 RepID=UPI0006949754|nr:glycosyltransferase 87 family protein [Streptacidiphilus neutrinimicus]
MTTVNRAIGAVRAAPRRTTVSAAAVAVVSLLAYAVLRHLSHVSMVDAMVYQAEGDAVAHGRDLYELRVGAYALPATYPPFSAMLFAPAAFLSFGALRVLVTLVNLVELAVVAALSCKLAGWPSRPLRPAAVLLVTGLGVWLEPVWTTLRYGQINLLILALVLWDLTLPESSRLKGVGIGLAAGLKVTPGFFVVYLLLTRRFRAAATAAASCALTVLVGLLVLPGASWDFWTKDLYDTTRVGKEYIVDNQSLRGMADRLLHSTHTGTATVLLAAAVAVAGLALAVLAERRCPGMPRAHAWAGMTVAITMVLVSPISWTHHWVWCVPLLVLLAAEARAERRRGLPGWAGHRWRVVLAGTALCFCSFAMWFVPHKAWHGVQMSYWFEPAASVYPLFGLAFLALVAVRVHRWTRPLPPPDRSEPHGASALGDRPRATTARP